MARRTARCLGTGSAALTLVVALTAPAQAATGGAGDAPVLRAGAHPLAVDEETEEELLQRDLSFETRRTAGDVPLSSDQAGEQRFAAARQGAQLRQQGAPPGGVTTFQSPWTGIGPDPIVQVTRSTPIFAPMSGRVGALAIRPSNGQFILGGAQGGIWLYDANAGTWSPKTDTQPSLAIGALAVAPSNDAIVYAGTGEGALSGDSYFGNGVLRSTDGGVHWTHVSGDYFVGVSISRVVVDPTNPDHVYLAALRGRGGARRTTPPAHSQYGIWESSDGAATWTLRKGGQANNNSATDLEIDPQTPSTLYASFWGDAIYKSTNGGTSWAPIMNGLPAGDFAGSATRFSISLSHAGPAPAVLYAGFNWSDAGGDHPAQLFKSVNAGASWFSLPTGSGDDSVEDYCAQQCSYDNVVEADPTNPDVVFAGGQFNYGIGSGGIFRSDDGGLTWKNLGWDQHPDFHAVAMDPSNTAHVLVGNDGGVRFSADRGGRPLASDPLNAADWQALDGTVDPGTAAVTHRSGLTTAQFTSIATVPTLPARFWGGTQDNGTLRKSSASNSWFDVASGDGGQVLVDPTDANFVYGTYFGITPYRYTDGGLFFFSNQFIRNGIDLSDRAEFYVPWVLNKENPNQLFLGTYRLYRTDNAKAPSAGDVSWKPISGDLTSGCPGTAPNGARGCFISAVGVGGGRAVYVGTDDGLLSLSTDAQVSSNPTWSRIGAHQLPNRPVTQVAVDRSNYRTAYVSYSSFNAATPSRPGHVFRTRDGGATFDNISGNLPDTPVNSVILDPAYANTLYVGTDVGAFVTYNGGAHWYPLGSGMPVVSVWQLDLDPSHRLLAAGTHGRGAYKVFDTTAVPALDLSTADTGKPVGPGSMLTYTLTLKNIGNADATGVAISDQIPQNTSFVSADSGGTRSGGKVVWTGLTVPAGGQVAVHMTVQIASSLQKTVNAIVNDGSGATSAQGPSTTGSPFTTPIAPPNAVTVVPSSATDGSRVGTSVPYSLTVTNVGYRTDSYGLSATTTWPAHLLSADCSTPITTTGPLAAGDSATLCVTVDVPAAASDGTVSTTAVKATSAGSGAVSASATLRSIAVAVDTLLVDQDGDGPDVRSRYTDALTADGVSFQTWDLASSSALPAHYVRSFRNVVWFTGNTYPGPLLPYEGLLAGFLDGGGRLLLSGQDILDQAAGTTSFVHDYLHIAWDGTEAQNDKATAAVHGVAGDTVTDGIGAVPLDHNLLGAAFEDRITPIGTATTAFTDDSGAPDALSFAGSYKVVFLAFPFEAYGSGADRADLLGRVVAFFGS